MGLGSSDARSDSGSGCVSERRPVTAPQVWSPPENKAEFLTDSPPCQGGTEVWTQSSEGQLWDSDVTSRETLGSPVSIVSLGCSFVEVTERRQGASMPLQKIFMTFIS